MKTEAGQHQNFKSIHEWVRVNNKDDMQLYQTNRLKNRLSSRPLPDLPRLWTEENIDGGLGWWIKQDGRISVSAKDSSQWRSGKMARWLDGRCSVGQARVTGTVVSFGDEGLRWWMVRQGNGRGASWRSLVERCVIWAIIYFLIKIQSIKNHLEEEI